MDAKTTQQPLPEIELLPLPDDFDLRIFSMMYRIRFANGKVKMLEELKYAEFTEAQINMVKAISDDMTNKLLDKYFRKYPNADKKKKE